MKRLTLLAALAALTLAPVAAFSAPEWPGWMTVHVSGLPSRETVRIQVQYENAAGAVKFTQQLAHSGSPARFPLGSKVHNLTIIASADESHKAKHLRFASVPSSVDINFNH